MIITLITAFIACGLFCYAYMVDMATITEIVLLLIPALPINVHFHVKREKYIRMYSVYLSLVMLVKLFVIPLWVGSIVPLSLPVTLQQGNVLVANAIVCVGAAVIWFIVAMAIASIESAKAIDSCEFKEDIIKIFNRVTHYNFYAAITMVIECIAVTIWYVNIESVVDSGWELNVILLIAIMVLVYSFSNTMIKREMEKKREALPALNATSGSESSNPASTNGAD